MDNVLTAMLARVPDSYDKTEGSIFHDALAPVSPEIVKLAEYAGDILNDRFLDSAVGDKLDRVTIEFGVERKAAQYASGEVTFTGTAGTVIAAGALVASETAQYYTKTDCTIPATVGIVCTEPGIVGNVGAGYITRLPVTLSGVTSVTNTEAIIGGYDKETDADLRERTYLKIRTPGTSGNKNDYVNWALSIDGVGGAKCIPLWDGAGTVKVVITDANGETAGSELISDVADHIETVRPVGADITIVSATPVIINVSAAVVLLAGYTAETVNAAITAAIRKYLQSFKLSGTMVSYAKVGAIILGVEGVSDYSGLAVNGGAVNIAIADVEVPVMGAFTNGA